VASLYKGESHLEQITLCEKTGQCCGGVVEVYIEVHQPQPKLFIFGAGHVGKAVCQTMEGTPFEVHLVDERSQWIESPEIPSTVVKHQTTPENLINQTDFKKQYVAVMTHSHDQDRNIISKMAKQPLKYLGLIGSETKWRRFKLALEKEGLLKQELQKVNCPMGINIGGKAPKEIAISLASEILSKHHGDSNCHH
jgi:xanthine dehydrogenase accessory factor